MVENWLFIFAVITILLIPGPTNALLASAAHHQGLYKTYSLIPMQLLGYVYGISLWALLMHLTLPIWPLLTAILHVIGVVYVLWLAFHLWKTDHLEKYSKKNSDLSRGQLFKATLKNPKSLLFAAGIFPEWTWESVENYAFVIGVFSLILIPCATVWIYFGRHILMREMQGATADRLYKGSAMLLMLSMLPVFIGFFNFK